jgi:hypothetical protein
MRARQMEFSWRYSLRQSVAAGPDAYRMRQKRAAAEMNGHVDEAAVPAAPIGKGTERKILYVRRIGR